MELLSETVINSTTHYVSDAWQQLTHLWEPHIIKYTPVRYGLPHIYGGYAKPKFGNRSFSPDLFNSGTDWPPPKTITVVDKLTDSTEAAAVTVFEGTLHLDGYDEAEVVYHAYGEEFTKDVNDQLYNNNLQGVFNFWCGASYLNLTLDTSGTSRASTSTVYWQRIGNTVVIDDLSAMAAFHSHSFYIQNGTLYLIDNLVGDGTLSLDEFEYFRGSSYNAQAPISLFKTDDGTTDNSTDGSYKYGNEYNLDPCVVNTAPLMATALGNVKTIMEHDYYRFRVVPEADKMPKIGNIVTVTNESLLESTTVEFIVTDIAVDTTKGEIVIEGHGAEAT